MQTNSLDLRQHLVWIVSSHCSSLAVTSPEAQVSVLPPCEPGLFSPIRPFRSAPPRKVSGRRTGKTHILTDTPVKNELAQRQRQKARNSSENESVGQVPCRLVQLPSLEVLESARWLMARRRQLRNPALLMLRKMTLHPFTAESCTARLAKSYDIGFAVKAAVRNWLVHYVQELQGTSAQDKHFICEICVSD